MFINKARDGKNNASGHRIAEVRKRSTPPMSQRMFADVLQRQGLDIDKNAVQRIESRQRFLTDIELSVIARVLDVTMDCLVDQDLLPHHE